MINLFCGWDERERRGYEVFVSSVRRRTAEPVNFQRLEDFQQRGTNAFTGARFLAPYSMGFQGHAIFCDAVDQIMLADVAELDALFDPQYAVQVVKHPIYQTRHRLKYRGTDMECPNVDYERKNWASVMLINCEHAAWRRMTPKVVNDMLLRDLLQLRFIGDPGIGPLPDCWNRLVDEGQPVEGAKIAHWTCGTPNLSPYYADAPGAELWRAEAAAAT